MSISINLLCFKKGECLLTKLVHYQVIDDKIAVVTLNRPQAANAMSHQLLNDLNDVINKLEQNKQIVCTIIVGAGDRVFCAGADLKERKGMSDDQVIQTVQYIGQTVMRIENLPMPVIAALNGVAFGGGLELALACDLRVAAEDVKLGLTETSLAIIPGAGGTQRLPRLIGLGQAKRLIYTAERLTAKEALDIGLIEQICASNVLDEAIELAKMISKNGPVALKQAKTAIDQGMQTDLQTGLVIEHLAYKDTIPTEDRLEGLQAFREKRKPQYKGK